MAADQVPDAVMQDLIRSGEARPLLPGCDIVPTSYRGQWWHVPADADDDVYVLAGPELSARFDQLRRRAERADAMLGPAREW